MRNIFLSIITLLIVDFAHAQHEQDSAWIRDNYTKKEVYIPMRDGVKLFTAMYLPKDATEKHPILFLRSPYSCAPYGENNFNAGFWNRYFRYYLRENYVIVFQDVRGRWMSEGQFVDVRPFNPNKKTNQDIDEASDSYDTIDWLIKNIQNNNGNVGVMGISYPGFYSTMAALSGHPALKAVSPQAPVTDWFIGDDFHHNGAFFVMDAFSFYASGFGYPRPAPTTKGPVQGLKLPENDNYETYLRIGALKNFMKLTGDSIAFWKDLYAHPNMDDWWKARNIRNFVNNVPNGTATLVVGGLFDAEDCFGAWRTYGSIEQKAKNNNKLVMGPWYHGQWSSNDGTKLGNIRFGSNTSYWYQNNIEIPFFNYYLKGKGDTSKLAEATVFFSGANQWKQFAQWPPAEKQNRLLYLQPGGKLGWEKPTSQATAGKPGAGKSFSEYISDPAHPVPYTEDVHYTRTRDYMTDDQRFASRRTDVLTFQTSILDSAITLAGPVVADLLTSISATDADFVVKLIDVFPDNFSYGSDKNQSRNAGGPVPMGGYQMLVRGEIMRGRYRNNFTTPEAFKPNKIERVKFELPDVAHTFQKGHRIMIQVQSSWFPLADRNPQKFVNIYTCDDSDFQKATIRVFHDAANSSNIVLPVIQ
jgi:putative CocE/NonD family hydrolase